MEQTGAVRRGNAKLELTTEELKRMIASAAYYRAEQRGFAAGHELEDWFSAEAGIKQLLGDHDVAAV